MRKLLSGITAILVVTICTPTAAISAIVDGSYFSFGGWAGAALKVDKITNACAIVAIYNGKTNLKVFKNIFNKTLLQISNPYWNFPNAKKASAKIRFENTRIFDVIAETLTPQSLSIDLSLTPHIIENIRKKNGMAITVPEWSVVQNLSLKNTNAAFTLLNRCLQKYALKTTQQQSEENIPKLLSREDTIQFLSSFLPSLGVQSYKILDTSKKTVSWIYSNGTKGGALIFKNYNEKKSKYTIQDSIAEFAKGCDGIFASKKYQKQFKQDMIIDSAMTSCTHNDEINIYHQILLYTNSGYMINLIHSSSDMKSAISAGEKLKKISFPISPLISN